MKERSKESNKEEKQQEAQHGLVDSRARIWVAQAGPSPRVHKTAKWVLHSSKKGCTFAASKQWKPRPLPQPLRGERRGMTKT